MWLEIENQRYCFNLVNKSPKVDIFNREKSSINFFFSCTERVNASLINKSTREIFFLQLEEDCFVSSLYSSQRRGTRILDFWYYICKI